MKNERLEELTELAKSALAKLPPLLLDGKGTFVRVCDGKVETVPSGDVLTMMTEARTVAERLCFELGQEPRRRDRTNSEDA